MNQNSPCELLLVDYGSIKPFDSEIKKLADKYEFKYIRGEGPIWSRSRSLNVGIAESKGENILFIDADCVIPNNYVKEHNKFITKKIFTYSPVYDTKQSVVRSSNIADLKIFAKKIRPGGISHMGIKRAWLKRNKGFNEQYRGWGGEDNDLWLRMKRSGMKPLAVSTYPYHLWHPPYGKLMEKIGKGKVFRKIRQQNRDRYFTLKNKQ
jgi:predicted glycosyltransferase involved in capsule biosynthesis